jgi:16S rRNA processing protein RimM
VPGTAADDHGPRSTAKDPADAPTDAAVGAAAGGETLLQIGHVVRPHGLKGEVIVSLSTNREERLDPGSVLTTRNRRELRVLRASAHKGRHIVAFEGVTDVNAAEELRGTGLFAAPLEDPSELWVHKLIGSRVEDGEGRLLGIVQAVEANPASDLLVLEDGGLVPLRFVVGHDPGVSVTVDVPDGLLDRS